MEPTRRMQNTTLDHPLRVYRLILSLNENGEFFLMRVETMMTILLAAFWWSLVKQTCDEVYSGVYWRCLYDILYSFVTRRNKAISNNTFKSIYFKMLLLGSFSIWQHILRNIIYILIETKRKSPSGNVTNLIPRKNPPNQVLNIVLLNCNFLYTFIANRYYFTSRIFSLSIKTI